MPIAFAQTNAPDATAPAAQAQPLTADQATGPRAENRVMPGQVRFSDMNGATVYDAQNKSVGDINNIVLDRDGRVAAVVVKTGAFLGIGGRKVAIGMRDLTLTTDQNGKPHFAVDMTKDQLKSAQAFDTSPPNTASGSSTPPADATRK
jgi:sporulation protein YlmC with PRC-barrel domain